MIGAPMIKSDLSSASSCKDAQGIIIKQRYFFDLIDGSYDLDDEGTELLNDQEAQLEAIRYAGSLLREAPAHFGLNGPHTIEVRNALGALVFLWAFGHAVEQEGQTSIGGKVAHPSLTLRQ